MDNLIQQINHNQVFYQQGGGDEQYTPRYGVEVLLPTHTTSKR